MVRILICDDEGIVRESLGFMIRKELEEEYQLEFAKNGRTAIELAESFRPDIILMDIQMPGINGLDAMREIRKSNKHVIFLVLTAYEKFEYTQKAISIGVMDYLTKPISREKLIDSLEKAIQESYIRREKIHEELEIKEKLEVVIPMIENGLVYSILMDTTKDQNQKLYKELLGIEPEYGYVLAIACGDELRKGALSNTVGAGIRLQKHYMAFRETIKEETGGFPGTLMENKVIIIVPSEQAEESYEDRLAKIERLQKTTKNLKQQFGLSFKAGIGSTVPWEKLSASYREAMEAVKQGLGKVNHIKDIQVECLYEDDYPVQLERELFAAVKAGNRVAARNLSAQFMRALQKTNPVLNSSVLLKAVEFVLGAEYMAYSMGGRLYRFHERAHYLDTLLSFTEYEDLIRWFAGKMVDACLHVENNQQEKADNVVEKAKKYIEEHYKSNISLDELAKELELSPYYFSRIFKETEGTSYIEYVTKLRMEYAKEQLKVREKSIKEVCVESGYSDPNYFSRIFKKWTGVTPTEFREGL